MQEDYTWETAGFDSFLSRSVDNLSQANLDAQGPVSTQLKYDAAQVTGALGNIFKVGNIKINGVKGVISVLDEVTGNETIVVSAPSPAVSSEQPITPGIPGRIEDRTVIKDSLWDNILIQTGIAVGLTSTDALETFPVPYAEPPRVFVSVSSASFFNTVAVTLGVSTTSFGFKVLDFGQVRRAEFINWVAIGQK